MIYLMDFCGLPWCILPWLLSGFLGFLMGYFWMKKWMAQFQDMEGKYNSLRKKHTQLESDLSDAKSAKATLEGDLATAQGVAKEKEAAHLQIQNSLNTVQADYSKIQGDYSKIQGDHAKTQADCSKIKDDLAKAQADNNRIKEDLSKAQADNNRLKDDLSKSQANYNKANDDYSKSKAEHAKTQDALDKCLASKKSEANLGSSAAGFAAGAVAGSFASTPKVEKAPEPKAEAPKAEAPKAEAPKATGVYAGLKSDNLQIIEGIGPKMESVLHDAGVKTWSNLAGKSHQELRGILDSHGDKYKIRNPSTWAEQATFAAKADWEGLISVQKNIDGAAGTKSSGGSDSKLEKIIGRTQKAGYAKYKQDDLKIVEGIGPKIAGLLVDGGINTWAKLAETPTSRIQEILDAAGPRYKLAKPGTWPQQAGLAATGKWEELKKLQDELDGGK